MSPRAVGQSSGGSEGEVCRCLRAKGAQASSLWTATTRLYAVAQCKQEDEEVHAMRNPWQHNHSGKNL